MSTADVEVCIVLRYESEGKLEYSVCAAKGDLKKKNINEKHRRLRKSESAFDLWDW